MSMSGRRLTKSEGTAPTTVAVYWDIKQHQNKTNLILSCSPPCIVLLKGWFISQPTCYNIVPAHRLFSVCLQYAVANLLQHCTSTQTVFSLSPMCSGQPVTTLYQRTDFSVCLQYVVFNLLQHCTSAQTFQFVFNM